MRKYLLVTLFTFFAVISLSAQNYEQFKKQREKGRDSLEQASDKFSADRQAQYEKFKKEYDLEFEKYKKNYNDFLNGEISVVELMASDDNIQNKRIDKKDRPITVQSSASREISSLNREKSELSKLTGEQFLTTLTKSEDKVERVSEGLVALKKINSSFDVSSSQSTAAGVDNKRVTAKEKPVVKEVKYEEESDETSVNKEADANKESVTEANAVVSFLPQGKPTNYNRISSPFGERIHPITHRKTNHKGVDLSAPNMTAIYATADGVVTYADVKGGYGNFVKINHQNGYKTAYAHLQQIEVSNNKTVHKGELIGYVGSTGQSTGNHLHYEMYFEDKLLDPAPSLSK